MINIFAVYEDLLHHFNNKPIMLFITSNSCNMGARDLPDMYARSPRAEGIRTYQANHERPCYKYYVSLPAL